MRGPPGDSLQPEAIGAVMEVTKWLKPSNSGHDLVTARVCRSPLVSALMFGGINDSDEIFIFDNGGI